jgi:4,5:9,10-diseco-3-hydroxy-5,9,17-trioxoandrosta-1(10),2-diene-4-oate hydrolase
MIVEERNIDVGGLPIHYLAAGEGPPLVLLHALGESALDWRWVLPALARTHCVYAPDLPGFGYSAKPYADYSPAFFARFVSAYLDALGLDRTALVGNSIGGLAALRLALSEPARVGALGLVASAGLGREVTYALRLPTLPGYGEAAIAWGKTPLGAFQRAWSRVPLLFGRPGRVPGEWITEQTQIAQLPGFTEATMVALRAQVDVGGQREVLVDQLPHLQVPTLVVWGERDRVFPYSQGQKALSRLRQGALELVSDCGHLPHVERPDRFAAILGRFLDGQASG